MAIRSLPWADIGVTALAPAIWGSTYIVTTELLPPDRPLTAALLRALPAGLLLTALGRRLPQPEQWWRITVLAALNIAVFQALLFVAAYRLPGGIAAVVGAVQPLLVMALAWGVEARRPSALAVGASLVGIAGMAALLLSPQAAWDALGVVAAFAGALSMAAGTWLSRRWQPDVPVLTFTGWQLLIGGLLLLPPALAFDPPLPPLQSRHLLGYLYLGGVGALLAYALWFRGIARLPSVAVSSLGLLSPVMAVVLGWVLLGQALSGQALIGLVTVLLSVLAVQWAAHRPTTAPSSLASPTPSKS
jgi:probable blue pigment (indigoidine) exporter